MNVPRLRFKEFSGEWEENKVGDISDKIIAGGTPSTLKNEYWQGDIRWMNSGELNLKRVYEVENRITKLGLNKSSTKLIPPKCILIGLAGQGKTRGTVAMNMVELCTNQSIASIYPKPETFNEEFLYHNLDNRYDELRGLSTGDGGRGGLNLQIIKSINIQLPTIPEQTKIANFLTAVDEKIAQLTQKADLLARYKKGVKQQIFSQQLRFKDDDGRYFPVWEEQELGDLCSTFKSGTGITSEQINNQGAYPVYGGNGLRGYTDTYTHDGFFVLIGRQGALCGNINRSVGKSYISEHAIAVSANEKSDTEWLAQKLDLLNLNRLSESSAQPGLAVNKLVKLKLVAPSKPEQTKIANFLTALDDKLNHNQTQLNALKQYKQGLLQQMFV